MAPRPIWKPITLSTVMLAVVHHTAIRVLLLQTAPDVSDEEFYWYNSMTEIQRQMEPGVSKASFRTTISSHVICRLKSQPGRNLLCYGMFTWRSFACANDFASRNVQRGS
jgi:hypothetical protein